jgi:hypothetical protein
VALEFTLDAEDVAAARLLAIGIRPKLEFLLFTLALAGMLAWSVSPWHFYPLPLLIGLTASLGAFRVIQIGRIREAALAAYRRNSTLRRPILASWDEGGVTIEPAGASKERILWAQLRPLRENERVVLLLQETAMIHAIPKRAFPDRAALDAFRALARRAEGKLRSR